MNNKKNTTKITSEKPVSLHPLEFEEALKELLKISPLPKEEKEQKENKKPSNKSQAH